MDRSASLNIDGKKYSLVLTTKATKEIAARYGGLEKIGDKLFENENLTGALDEIVWLITLLANQGIMIENLKSKGKQELLTEEKVSLLTSPIELSQYKENILEAMNKGTKRYIESEEHLEKNSEVE